MAKQDRHSAAFPTRESVVPSRRRLNFAAAHRGERFDDGRYLAAYRRLLARHRRFIRRVGIGSGILVGLLVVGCLGLWWRLSNGPIQLDVVTPWLVSAIEENFGGSEHVEVGGTQIERTESGGAAVRIRDIVVRDADGTVVASAPKAEVRVSGMGLLSGHMRAESLNLVGAEMAVRIEPDGDVTVFAGANKHPFATASVPAAAAAVAASANLMDKSVRAASPPPATAPTTVPSASAPLPVTGHSTRLTGDAFAALLSWIDGIGETGLDGHDLRELGLKNGNITVDDERTGKRWTFKDISLSMERPHGGGVVVTVGSDNPERRWGLTASVTPTQNGYHTIQLEGRQVFANDLLLASRLGDGTLQANLPLSASVRAEIGPDGMPDTLTGRIVADTGFISDSSGTDGRIDIDRAEFKFNWDPAAHVLSVPFQILSGGDRITLLGQIEAPPEPNGIWSFKIGGGTVVLNAPNAQGDSLILNRIAVSGRYDAGKRRFIVDEGDIGNMDVRVAMSGNADDSSGDLRLTGGFAGTRMPVDTLKRIWPVFVAPKVRDWFMDHLTGGTVERLVIAVNAPLNTLKASGPPLPDDGLSIDAVASNCVIQPVNGLPAIRDADLNVHIVGRDAQITLGKGTADLPSGRKVVVSSALFEVPDTAPHEPPARVHFKIDGPVPAALELLSTDRLRDAASVPFDPSTTRGTMSGLVSLALPLRPDPPPGSTNYAIAVDATNFSADHMIMGQKVDAAALKVSATPLGFEIKGDVKIGGTPASLDYRKMRSDSDAEVHIQGMLDETARRNLGLDPSNSISGAIPIRLAGHVSSTSERDGRFTVEADLTPARIDGYLPGWVKQAGKPARATFTVTTKPQSTRIEDLLIEGTGGGVKGVVDFDGSGDLQSANFPSYGFSDGDKTSLKVERVQDGALRVVMRGEVYDGRAFVKAVSGGPSGDQPSKRQPPDIDLDMKLGAVVGFNGEAVRSLDLKMSRRAGEIRSFGMSAKIGRDATLTGDLRSRAGARQVIALDTTDAGAFLRFTDVYSRMSGGQMTITMDPPSANNPAQQGVLNVHNFNIHDESQLQRAVVNGAQGPGNSMDFSGMRVEFTKTAGRVALRDGVVRGPVLGGTIDGMVDYARDEVHMRGTLIPLYGPNNLLGQLPLVGPFLGGDKEGLLGVTYEVVGRPGNPVLHVNPISALAPGLLRKVFEFPATSFTPSTVPYGGLEDNH